MNWYKPTLKGSPIIQLRPHVNMSNLRNAHVAMLWSRPKVVRRLVRHAALSKASPSQAENVCMGSSMRRTSPCTHSLLVHEEETTVFSAS